MSKLSKQAAKKANHLLDATAADILKNAGAYGIKPEIAKKFAFQCDIIADHIAKRAGVDLAKLAEQRKLGLTGDDVFDEGTKGFDPEEIGVEQKGPAEQDADEKYMSDQFTQQWFRELREKQEAGEVSDGKGSPEAQAPQAGIQASAKSASRLEGVILDMTAAANRLASSKDAGVSLLGKHIAQANEGLLKFQAKVKSGEETEEKVAAVLTASGHVLPHLAGEVASASAMKLARMVGILANQAK